MIICSPQLGISPQSVLGGEVYDREVLLGLSKKNVNIEIILPKGLKQDINIKNWRISHLPLRHIPAPLFNLLIVPYLFKIHRENKFKIIRLHSPMYVGLGALFFRLFNHNIKIVATFHQFKELNIYGLGKVLNKYWDHIICDSLSVKEKIAEEYFIPKSKITVVHNGVPNYLKPQKKKKNLLKKLNINGKFVMLFMGLFIKRKNPLFLLEVLKSLLAINPNIIIIFWGQGPLKISIIKKAKELNIFSNIRFLDPIYGKEKTDIHNLADIFLHPAIDEGFALAPLEAMACAKPVLMNDAHSAKEAVRNDDNGFLCNVNDVSDWTKKTIKIIQDPKLKRRMGLASRKKVLKEFQWSLTVDKHLEVFNALI